MRARGAEMRVRVGTARGRRWALCALAINHTRNPCVPTLGAGGSAIFHASLRPLPLPVPDTHTHPKSVCALPGPGAHSGPDRGRRRQRGSWIWFTADARTSVDVRSGCISSGGRGSEASECASKAGSRGSAARAPSLVELRVPVGEVKSASIVACKKIKKGIH